MCSQLMCARLWTEWDEVIAPIKRVLLIVNPGSRRGARIVKRTLSAFVREGVHCDVVSTSAPRHAGEIARERGPGYDAVFTSGGDGTVMEVLEALPADGPPVGVLAGGTGNVIARNLRIPRSPRKAVPQLLHGKELRIDLGRLGDGRKFAIGVGVGLDAAMIEGATAPLKRRIGFLAYMVGGYRAARKLATFDLRLTVDGVVFERRASAVMIANFGAVLNDFITFGDGIAYDDGLLNACVFTPGSFFGSVRIFWKMIRRDFRPDPAFFYREGREFTIETFPPHIAQADGELLGNTPISVSVEALAAKLLVPLTAGRA